MKKVLITGKNGYVSRKFAQALKVKPQEYYCECTSIKDNGWLDVDFSKYDVIVHTAAIVHQKESKENAASYKLVNTDLTYELALKAKQSGVRHFVFMSSMSVYGLEGEIGKSVVIAVNTPCQPTTLYGKSKLEAEKLLLSLEDTNFVISIVRPPMIYGPNCPGNYARLRKLAMHWSIYPQIDNKRSMIFIDNLCFYLEKIINDQLCGTFLPQNIEYVCTSDLIQLIAKQHGRKVCFSKLLGSIVKVLHVGAIKKLYGNLVYEKETATPLLGINRLVGFEESICISEKEWDE